LIARSHARPSHARLARAIGSAFSELHRRGRRSGCGARLAMTSGDLGRLR